jgi:hypothetical protein
MSLQKMYNKSGKVIQVKKTCFNLHMKRNSIFKVKHLYQSYAYKKISICNKALDQNSYKS